MRQSVESEIGYSIQGTSPRAGDKLMMKPLQTLLQKEERCDDAQSQGGTL